MSTAARLTRTERIALRDARRAAAVSFDLLALLEGPTTAEDIAADAEAAAAADAEEARLAAEAEARKCRRCNGTGTVSGFRHHLDGICFACNGTGLAGHGGPARRLADTDV